MIGIFALSAALKETDLDKYQSSLKQLNELKIDFVKASNLEFKKEIFNQAQYFTCGSVEDRVKGLENLNCNKLLSLKGGYGSLHCLDHLDLSFFDNKSIFGYSDLTALFLSLQKNSSVRIYHSPMLIELAALSKEELDSFMYFLKDGIVSKKALYENTQGLEDALRESNSNFVDNPSYVWGGNLTLLLSMNTFPKIKSGYKNILFIEDCFEEAYKVERMLYSLVKLGYLDTIDELWLGKAKEALFNMDLLESFSREFNFKLVTELPFGHNEKFTLPIFNYFD